MMEEHDRESSPGEGRIEEMLKFYHDNPGVSHWHAPVFQDLGRRALERKRAEFEAGNEMALLAAIRACAMYGLVIPDWAAAAYFSAYDRVAKYELSSWDAVFGKPHRGKHLAEQRRRYELSIKVFLRIVERRTLEDPPPALDEGLFESVGAEFGIKKTLCAELYYREAIPRS